MIKLIVVRHGKTDWNERNLLQGRSDIPLNDKGIEDALELKEKLKSYRIDMCICSPLIRAKQTAETIIDKTKIIYDEMLVERDCGELEGKVIDLDYIRLFWDYKLNSKMLNCESLQDLLLRAKLFLGKIKDKYDGKTILIVSHGAFIKALHFTLAGYDENTDFLSFNPKNTTIYKYSLGGYTIE